MRQESSDLFWAAEIVTVGMIGPDRPAYRWAKCASLINACPLEH
jgi:hypothetical protein